MKVISPIHFNYNTSKGPLENICGIEGRHPIEQGVPLRPYTEESSSLTCCLDLSPVAFRSLPGPENEQTPVSVLLADCSLAGTPISSWARSFLPHSLPRPLHSPASNLSSLAPAFLTQSALSLKSHLLYSPWLSPRSKDFALFTVRPSVDAQAWCSEEMTQSSKCLPCRREDLGLTPSNHM